MSTRLLVATRKGLITLNRKGRKWSIAGDAAFVGTSVPMVLSADGGKTVYAALGHGHFGIKVHRSDNGGKTFTEVAAPAYPEFPKGREPDKCPMRGIEIPWRVEMIWSLAQGSDGVLWCGTLPGGLFKSADRGQSWEIVRALWDVPERKRWMGGGYDYPGIHSICIHPKDPRKVTVAISCGGVWTTENAGKSWTLGGKGMRNGYLPPDQAYDPVPQDPHRLAQCEADPDQMWIQHHNGIFRSTDGGTTFKEIKKAGPSIFGFAVAVHPRDGKTAWFAPAVEDVNRTPVGRKVVVTRTRDGGKKFDVLSDGLPKENAYDLIYRHALEVDETGEYLAMGSTTGSLWISGDQGDSWKCVSANLPPIYTVQFVRD